MRILVATDQWFPDLKGGSARVAAETASRLARRGHEVTVLAPEHKQEPASSSDGSLTLLRAIPRGAVPQTFSDPLNARRQAGRLVDSGFDVVVAHQATLAVGLLAARLAAPLVLVYHASVVREMNFLRSRLPFGPKRLTTYALKPPLVLVERLAVGRAARLLILSEFTRTLLKEDYPRVAPRAVRVPGGVDIDTFSPADGHLPALRAELGARPDVLLLLTVRRLEPRMGLEDLLHAVRRLRDHLELDLVIVGGGMLDGKLRRLSAELGLERHVRFAGRVSDGELVSWYRASDLFVLPTQAYEGFGMVTVEALACGTPVVGTPVGATPELLRPLEPALVAEGSDADALAEAIASALALATPEFRRRCREYAVTRFDWNASVAAWERALEETVTNSSSTTGDAAA